LLELGGSLSGSCVKRELHAEEHVGTTKLRHWNWNS